MINGKTTPEIAEKLFISYHTVENHKKNLSNSLKGRVSPNKGKKLNDEWINNLSKGHELQKKPVKQLSLNGNLIMMWESIGKAQKTLNIRHMSECCRNKKNKTTGGYKWEYYENK